MTTTDTRAALEAAIDAYGCDAASHGALGKDAMSKPARPTPDEARRLVDEYDRATRNSYVTGGPEALRAARTALISALTGKE